MNPIRLLIPAIVFCTLSAGAQTVQPGVVKEYRGKSPKVPLAGVELNISQANNTASDKNGNFTLNFRTLKPGNRVTVRAIEKDGYEVYNKETIDQWNINPERPFTVVMCSTATMNSMRKQLRTVSTDSYKSKYDKARREIDRLKKEGKIKEQDYQKQMNELFDNYQKQLDNLENYIDRFARIDLSELSATEQEIIDLVHQGRIDEAIERYDNLNLVDKLVDGLKQKQEINDAINNLNDLRQSQSQSNDSLYAMVKRQIETLQLQGDPANNRKIAKIYCDVADADTTNIDWLTNTGIYISNYIAGYDKALEYYFKVLDIQLKTLEEEHPDIASSYNNIGVLFSKKSDNDSALDYFNKALDIQLKILGGEHPDVATSYNNIGHVFSEIGDYDQALDFCNKALDIRIKLLDDYDIASSCNSVGIIYTDQGDYYNALQFHSIALKLLLKLFGENHIAVATSYNNIGYVFSEIGDYDLALDFYDKALYIWRNFFDEEHPTVADSYHNIGYIYSRKGDSDKAIDYYKMELGSRLRHIHPTTKTHQ